MNIDFKRVFLLLLPIRLRNGNLLIALLDSIGSVLNVYFLAFTSWLSRKKYELAITPQVCYLERLVNDEFDNVLRRIYISEPSRLDTQYFYRNTDNRNWYFVTGKFYVDDTRFGYAYDFIINIPVGLVYNANQMKALINNYKLCGKTYKIIQTNE